MSIPSNTSGIYCPGCQPGDFPQQHICGLPMALPTQWSEPFLYLSPQTERLMCAHCWCLEDAPGGRMIAGVYRVVDKAHEVCCTCGSRRLKD